MTDAALVTGAAGFLGSHICDRLLDKGLRVYSLDNYMTGKGENLDPLVIQRTGDVIDFAKFGLFDSLLFQVTRNGSEKLKYVFNFACPASPPKYQSDPIHTMLTSVLGTNTMLELARVQGAKFIQASTSEIYGDPEEHPQSESYRGCVNTTGPRACYDEGKRAAEALCYDYVRKHNVDVRVVRIFNTYGPRMDPNDGRVVTNFINQALRNEPLTIYGDGRQTRSFCYVDDLVDGIMSLAALDRKHSTEVILPVNIGNPIEYTMMELASSVLQQVHGNIVASRFDIRPLPIDDPTRRKPNIARAKSLLGWEPKVSLDQGLARTIEYFRNIKG